MKKSALAGALIASVAFALPTWAENQEPEKATDASKKHELLVPVYVNEVVKPYTLIKKVNAEIYVLDARSEADAELKAFKQLQKVAQEIGADGMIDVKRYVVKDAVAVRPSAANTGSFLGDDVDATATVIDQLTIDSYERGQGTLSTAVIDETFDRSRFSQKTVRFTGKAIKFEE